MTNYANEARVDDLFAAADRWEELEELRNEEGTVLPLSAADFEMLDSLLPDEEEVRL